MMRTFWRVGAVLALALSAPSWADELSERAAAELLHKKLEKERPADKALLDAVKGRDVVVVQGGMDRIEQVLAAARIRHTVIAPEQIARHELTSSMILMVNCPGVMPAAAVKRIERFVRAGGLLYTTDWALKNVVEPAFPKTIRANGRETFDEVVPVKVTRHDDALMSQLLLRKGGSPQWWLEGGSYPVRILDPERVEVLAQSEAMASRYGSSAVVVRFRHHDGEVIHVVSHFYRQLGTQGPKVAAASAAIEGLSDSELSAWKGSAAAKASTIGDVESSYAFQKMTTNLVISKQRRNQELDQLYRFKAKGAAPLLAQPRADARPVGAAAPDAKLRILEDPGGAQVKVRDDRGNEGWMSRDALVP